MSTIRANTITDTAGTGAPTFSNGIISNGNVGIGTSSPTSKLDVRSGDITVSRTAAATAGDAAIYFGNGNTNYIFGGNVSNIMAFAVNGSEQARIDASGNFKFNSGYGSVATVYGCRAWVNFNGQGVPAIRASGNVTSITDGGVGTYTVNLTIAMPDANFAAVTGGQNEQGNNGYIVVGSLSASSVQVFCRQTSAFGDGALINVAVFR